MSKKILTFILLMSLSIVDMYAQPSIERIEPANWWVGMKNPHLILLVYGKNVAKSNVKLADNSIALLEKIEKTDNANYLFVYLSVKSKAKAGDIAISFSGREKDTVVKYSFLERKSKADGKAGFNPTDAMYLITPDRFANGNPKNDSIAGYTDTTDRRKPDSRHGGDIAGISQHLGYISKLGFTTVWINPLLENNMPQTSYHGYAITDFYKIDPRFGSNKEYCDFVKKAHDMKLKVVMDFVLNHCGSSHWWHNDLPSKDWYHQFDSFTRTSYRASTLIDPYASQYDKAVFEKGWFDNTMPDLNQKNPLVATYLIQNTLWWIETSSIDGIRLDTQPYSDMEFLNDWAGAVNAEYPDFSIVGESWFSYPAFTACFQRNQKPISSYSSQIGHVTDFPLCFAMLASVNDSDDWDNGMAKVYNTLCMDFLYADAMQNLIFLSNHDLSRLEETVKGDIHKYKMLVTMLATLRGIPQFYYGDEILLPGDKAKGDGRLRKDMPGGWPSDKVNVFTNDGLSAIQKEALDFTRQIFTWRKNNPEIAKGRLVHFVPNNGLYVYSRIAKNDDAIVVFVNNNKKPVKVDSKVYAELLKGAASAKNVITGEEYNLSDFSVAPKTAIIIELKDKN